MKKIALLLALITIFNLGVFASAEEISDGEQGILSSTLLIKLFGITEKGDNQIFREALIDLANKDKETLHKVLNSIAKTVDEYSYYYDEEEWQDFQKSLSGTVCGIGVTAIITDGYFEVVTVLEGGSAKEGGIVPGDRIIEADGIDLTGTKAENATAYITGEEGTFVALKVRKGNGEIKEYTLQRRKVVVPSLASTVLDGNIGYIAISSFTENTHLELEKELKDFKEKNIEKLIIDLRNNGGGVMESGLGCASLLMEKDKTIISTKGKESEEPKVYKTDKDGYKFKSVLLTNEYTASAAEIMTCALVDNGYAVSVGNTTYGKACAQALYPLSIGGALRITTLNYYTPKGISINKTGVEATHRVKNEKYFVSEKDLPKLSYQFKFKVGDVHEDIEKIEEMLYNLNYLNQKPDNTFDENTKKAVAAFQSEAGLFPYGVCDMTTQSYLITKYSETEFLEDCQLDYALELLK